MGDIVNLNRFRKSKARRDKVTAAAENRVKFGRKKSERNAAKSDAARSNKELDGHRLNDKDSPET
ncbi:MAG: DUF4169 family protein [Alphaproteobacteria bacterium]|nr:DUF4169 family protein [Alphaproteobacteria bacterium]